jgi:apolipoprotein D and lipocalin family protein
VKKVVFGILFVFGAAAAVTGSACSAGEPSGAPRTVDSVDLERYAGLWYEIAKIPNRFQRKCDSGTTAEYRLRDDGLIGVVNRCRRADGEVIESTGAARVVDAESRAKLEVSFVNVFGLRLFWGDYWVIGLDGEYRWAIVGHPERRYGWVLARSPSLSPGQWEAVRAVLVEKGYDPNDFEMTPHGGAAQGP